MLSARRGRQSRVQASRVERFVAAEIQRKNQKRRNNRGLKSPTAKLAGPKPTVRFPVLQQTFRYRAALSSDLQYTVNTQDTALLVCGNGTGTGYLLVDSFKIRRITLWGISDTSPGGSRVGLRIEGAEADSQSTSSVYKQLVDEGTVLAPACITYAFQKLDKGWYWIGLGSTSIPLFTVEARSGSEIVIDLEVEYRQVYGTSRDTVAVSGLAADNVLFTALDALAATPVLLADVPATARTDSQISYP